MNSCNKNAKYKNAKEHLARAGIPLSHFPRYQGGHTLKLTEVNVLIKSFIAIINNIFKQTYVYLLLFKCNKYS